MPTAAFINATKKHLFTHALAMGEVTVRFNPLEAGVEMPGFLDPQSAQDFAYGLNQPKPIPDLVIGVEGIRATLSFGCQPHMTFVPWVAVGALIGEAFAIVFPIADGVQAGAPTSTEAKTTVPAVPPATAPKRSGLSLVR